MADLFFTYLRTGIAAGVMILAVILVRPLLRKAPRNISCLLWLLVALRLLLPFRLESPLSLQPRQLTEPLPMTQVAETPVPDYEPLPEVTPVIPAPDVPTDRPRVEPETLFATIWASGTLAMLLYATVSYVVLQYRVRDAVKTADGAWESDRIGGAFLLGYVKPRICLPTGLSLRDRKFILAHELAHKRRGDHWWKLLGMVCLSIHWYNPLVWLGYALLCRDIETACDESVIRSMELEERRSYSFALLNSGKRLSGFLAYPVAFGEISLKERIKGVLSYRKPGLWITAAATVLTLVVAVCFMTTPTTAYLEPPEDISGVQTTEPTTEPTTAATEPTTVPTKAETQPPAETTAATEPVTVPPEATTPSTEPPTVPTTKPPVSPTEPATAPTTPTVPPTEPKPTQPPATTPPATEPPVTQPDPTVPPATQPPKPVVTLPTKPSAPTQEDNLCGENIIWEYNEETRHLTLQGSGPMRTDTRLPWEAYKEKILSLTIGNGITTISPYAFSDCTDLRSVSIPGSVAMIGTGAFEDCTSLKTLHLYEGLQTIGAGAFEDTGIRAVTIPKTVTLINNNAFSSCEALCRITFTGPPPRIKPQAFLWTTATAYYPEHTGTWVHATGDYGGNITWELCCSNHSYINGICERCGAQKGA